MRPLYDAYEETMVRYAADIVVGFEFKGDAEPFWAELKERIEKF